MEWRGGCHQLASYSDGPLLPGFTGSTGGVMFFSGGGDTDRGSS